MLSGQAAIVGIGATDFSKNSGRSELRLAAEAVLDALADAGLSPTDVDGLTTFTMDTNTEIAVARAAGIGELTFFSKIHYGGGAACATVQHAAMAVATGVADVVVAYRAFNERSGMRFGQVQTRLTENADSTGVDNSFSYPHGLSTPAAQVAMIARRYMHLSGATSRDFGAVSVADRKHAANNPKAYFYGKPITIEDHQNSRWIAEPLPPSPSGSFASGFAGYLLTYTIANNGKEFAELGPQQDTDELAIRKPGESRGTEPNMRPDRNTNARRTAPDTVEINLETKRLGLDQAPVDPQLTFAAQFRTPSTVTVDFGSQFCQGERLAGQRR